MSIMWMRQGERRGLSGMTPAKTLAEHYEQTGQGATIALSEQHRRMLDALAEAADIPHQRGQTDIVIPEQLRNYNRTMASVKDS